MQYRIGNGYDVHRFAETSLADAFITLGGIEIPHTNTLIAHSDGDVLIHALCDALLGGLALGDIGQHFPDSDNKFKGISSQILLKEVYEMVTRQHWTIANLDITVVAQSPKLLPFINAIRSALAFNLSIFESAISVKATTTEGLGFAGRKEGIAVYAVVLLQNDIN